ncbi:hypothetical protein RJ639_006260 [Escallonia herrerae]|uniref:Transposase (putative) gypsy type domain-containing protein n=1 Tax=Escallonia herrerae TaxID=1293975 RepID=A0AA88W093_9ASTE|nr:hypothetical protein RJ639_006260 [Escallonia herrerae]
MVATVVAGCGGGCGEVVVSEAAVGGRMEMTGAFLQYFSSHVPGPRWNEIALGAPSQDRIVFGILSLCSGRVFGHNFDRAEPFLAFWHSARAECLDTILLGQNRVRPFGTLLGQSVRERFCSGRTVFGHLALCSGRVFRNDSARAEPCSAVWHSARAECSDTILLELNRVRSFGTLLGQSVRERFCSGRTKPCSNRVRLFGILLGQSIREGFCSGRTMFGRLALCPGEVFGNDSTRSECSSLAVVHPRDQIRFQLQVVKLGLQIHNFCDLQPQNHYLLHVLNLPSLHLLNLLHLCLPKNALGDVKDQAEDGANPKPWYTTDEKSSKMSTEDLVELLREYPLPEGWYACLLGLQEPANYGMKYETRIYEEQVKSRYRLPLHPFVLRFFEHYNMAPGQLIPNGWRKLVGLIYLVQTSGYKPDATNFMRVFFEICFVKGVTNCPGWYYIHSRQ